MSKSIVHYKMTEMKLLSFCFVQVAVVLSLVACVHSGCTRNPVIFNFGDSNSDTGGFCSAYGFTYLPPYGRAFFRDSTDRVCDGRLIIDFLCESLNSSFLTPYLESTRSNFTNGANFAISGSRILPREAFNLNTQLNQFNRFKSLSLQLASQGFKGSLVDEDFKNAVYTFDIGQNDLDVLFTYSPFEQAVQQIPSLISAMETAIWTLYAHGGRNFWIHNTGPLGCLPKLLAKRGNASDFDNSGCIKSFNVGAKIFNQKLSDLCGKLRSEMKNATIVYVDVYAVKYDLIANAPSLGFENPLMACCGNGGPPYNYNPKISCRQEGYNVCTEGSKHISWDGIHYTEAANSFVSSRILSSNYSTPQIKLDHFCAENI